MRSLSEVERPHVDTWSVTLNPAVDSVVVRRGVACRHYMKIDLGITYILKIQY